MNKKQQIMFAEMAQAAVDALGKLFGEKLAEMSPMSSLIACGNLNRERKQQRYYVVLVTNDEATRLKEWFDATMVNHLQAMKKAGIQNGKDVHVEFEPKDWPTS